MGLNNNKQKSDEKTKTEKRKANSNKFKGLSLDTNEPKTTWVGLNYGNII